MPIVTDLQRQKGPLEKAAGSPSQRLVLHDSGGMPSLYCYLRCGDLRSPGVTERCNGSLGLRDDDDEGWLVSKMEGTTNSSRHLQAVRNRDCWAFENHWHRVQWRRQDFVSGGHRFGGAQVWRREKTENNKCMSYHPRQHCILLSMRYCIRPVCHSHTIIKWRYTIV